MSGEQATIGAVADVMKKLCIKVTGIAGTSFVCTGLDGFVSLVPAKTLATFDAQGHEIDFGNVAKPHGYDRSVATQRAELEARAADPKLYDFNVRLANGITAVICACDAEQAERFVKGILGRFGGKAARIVSSKRGARRADQTEPHVVTASALRRFVESRRAGRRPKYRPSKYSARYQRKTGPFAQTRRRK